MASPQCLGYSHYKKVTRSMCDPPKSVILSTLRKEIKRINAQYIFVATDHDPMISELEKAFGHMNVSISSKFSFGLFSTSPIFSSNWSYPKYVHSEKTILPNSFRPSQCFFVQVIPKQRKTKQIVNRKNLLMNEKISAKF